MTITRRTFIKHSGLAALTAAVASRAPSAAGFTVDDRENPFSADEKRLHTVCGMCAAGCYVDAFVRDGRLLRLEGNPADPETGGKICARGKAATAMLYDVDRLKYPLKRVGRRGEGRWRRISWAEAVDTISAELEKSRRTRGASLGLLHGGSSSTYIKELFTTLGCRRFASPAFESCRLNQKAAFGLTKLASGSGPGPATGCMVLVGANPGENIELPMLRGFVRARAAGASLIVVDPRCSTAASKADHHLMIRPGTDTALILGWLRHILDAGLYRFDRAEQLPGFDKLREHIKQFRLDEIAAVTDIPVRLIKKTAELMAASAPETWINPTGFSRDPRPFGVSTSVFRLAGEASHRVRGPTNRSPAAPRDSRRGRGF